MRPHPENVALLDASAPDIPHGAEPESAIVGPVAGRYDIGERIARGGMGIVYRAHDRLLDRVVAVKVMRARFLSRPDFVRRFLAEARISARLQHPGIVPVYEVGSLADGRPFIAMKLIEGQTLARLLRDRSTPAENQGHFLTVFQALCQTIAYAHQQGVIHRDLKPDNVMVGPFGEVQVMDWGLAKDLDHGDAPLEYVPVMDDVELAVHRSVAGTMPNTDQVTEVTSVLPVTPSPERTSAGEVFGTLPFMPPEQARGEADRMDRRGDVFALGAILCQILTGQPPYFGTPERMRENARGGKLFGAHVMLDRCGADAALVLLAKQCLAAAPNMRPSDGAAVAEMISRCLDGLQDRTRQMEVGRLTAEFQLAEEAARHNLSKRSRQLVRVIALSAAMVSGLVVGSIAWYVQDRSERSAAEAQRDEFAQQQMDEAVAEATTQVQIAATTPDPRERERAVRQARAAVQRTASLGEAHPATQAEGLDDLKTRVAALERDVELELAIEQLRGQLFGRKSASPVDVATQCTVTLATFDLDLANGQPEAIAQSLRASAASPSVLNLLGDWLAVADEPAQRRRLARVLKAADAKLPPEWLAAFESATPETDAALADAPIDGVPASLIVAVARRVQSNRPDLAERLLVRGVRKYPHEFSLNADLGARYQAKPAKRDEAIRYLTAARAARPTDPNVAAQLGPLLAATNRGDEAFDLLQSAVQADPDHPGARLAFARLCEASGRAKEAKEHYTVAALMNETAGAARARLGRMALAAGDEKQAEVAFLKAREAGWNDADVCHGLGTILLKKWEAVAAVRELSEAVRREPSQVSYRLTLVEAHKVNNDPAAALSEAKTAARLDSRSIPAHRAVADLALMQKDRMAAVVALRKVVEIEPASVADHRRLADLFHELKHWAGAAKHYAIVAPHDADPIVLDRLSASRELTGDRAGAIQACRQRLQVQPSASARYQLGRLLAADGDEAGLAELTKAVDELPDAPQAVADLGHAQLAFGRFAAAAATLRRAAAMRPEGQREALLSAAREATTFAALEPRVDDALTGAITPSTGAAFAQLAEVSRRTKRYAAAARLYARAAEFNEQFGRPAAIAAALAGFNLGTDAMSTTAADRSAWRSTAVLALSQTENLVSDPALRPLRDARLVESLPEAERGRWRALLGIE